MFALELIDITKSFGKTEILNGINIALEKGEFLVLLGASGCGKSTVLNIIAGLADPTSGQVLIGGRDVSGVHPKDRNVAMVFQSYALYPNLSVARNIGFGLEMHGVAADERDAAVRKVAGILRISELLDRRPAQLSGGQRQRVAIGRALVRDPEIFLFDEPLSNLDAKLRMEMRAELKRLQRMLGTTTVYVTHDQIEAMTLATRIAVMRNGRIEQIGTPEEIYRRPATLHVAEFVGSPPMNLLRGRIEDGAVRLEGAPEAWPLPGSTQPVRDVIIGLRPEDVHLATPQDTISVEVGVDLVDMTGPELVVSALAHDQRLIATLPPKSPITSGDHLRFGFAADSMHLFDPETGLRLELPTPT